MFNSVYEGKKVLITGHTGFKGSWLTLWLLELGAEVIGYSLKPPTKPSLFEALQLDKKITHIIGDVRDKGELMAAFIKYQPEIVFHLAAQSLVKASYENPLLTYETNIMGTVNLFEAVRKTASVKVLVNVTSDKCYENKEWLYGYREIDPMGGYDPYSSSKGCAEIITAAYRNSFFNPVEYGKTHKVALSSVRAGNVIGGGDWGEDRIVPDCIKALSQNKPISIRNPQAIRPWQYVLEPLSGYLWLGALMSMEPERYSQAWNFGPSNSNIFTVEEMVAELLKLWGCGKHEIVGDTRFHEAKLLKLDTSKSQFYLKWRQTGDIHFALEKTVNWYKHYYSEKDDMYNYTRRQIEEYVEKAISSGVEWSKKKG